MVFNTTFNNISVITWWSVLVMETGVSGENLPQVTYKRYNVTNVIIPNIIKNQFYWLKDIHMT